MLTQGGELAVDASKVDAATVGVRLECVGEAGGATCDDVVDARLSEVRWSAGADTATPHDVLLLVDQSGSMAGIVDRDDNRERRDPTVPDDFGDRASDGKVLRLAAARQLIHSPRDVDRLGMIGFNEGGTMVPCAAAADRDLPASAGERAPDALTQEPLNVRHTFRGYWQAGGEAPIGSLPTGAL